MTFPEIKALSEEQLKELRDDWHKQKNSRHVTEGALFDLLNQFRRNDDIPLKTRFHVEEIRHVTFDVLDEYVSRLKEKLKD